METHKYSSAPSQEGQRQPAQMERPNNVYAPEGREKLPPDRAARQRLLEKCFKKAHRNAARESARHITLGRVALAGLVFLELIRAVAWWDGNMPGSVFGVHFLTTTTDAICFVSMLPLYVSGTTSQCVRNGCVGPILTLTFAMFIVDFGALCTFMTIATPRPLSPGSRSFVDVAEAIVGAWDFVLVSSVSLQVALCASSWRIYKSLRENGLYPPGTKPLGAGGVIEDVSFLELVCEAEDAKLINDYSCQQCGDAGPVDSGEATVSPSAQGQANRANE